MTSFEKEDIERIVHDFVNNCRYLIELAEQSPYRRKVMYDGHNNYYSDDLFEGNTSFEYHSDGTEHTGAVFRGSHSALVRYNTETGLLFIDTPGKFGQLEKINCLILKYISHLKEVLFKRNYNRTTIVGKKPILS